MQSTPFSKSRVLGFVLILPMLLAVCGCGNQLVNVSGTVTYQAKPVKGGSVIFISTEGKPSVSTEIREDGTYTAEKVPVGTVKICVDTEALNPAKRTKAPKYGPPAGQTAPSGFGEGDPEAMTKRYTKIPPAYAKEGTTELTYTVISGDQTYNIELK